MPAYQLVYTSLPSKRMRTSDLYIILRQARANNRVSGVTGLLVYADQHFFQLLEGDKEVVSQLFQKISNDARHTDIRVLCGNEASEKLFPNWEMAYATPSARDLANWAGLDNTTTVEDTLKSMHSDTGRVTEVLSNLLNKSALS